MNQILTIQKFSPCENFPKYGNRSYIPKLIMVYCLGIGKGAAQFIPVRYINRVVCNDSNIVYNIIYNIYIIIYIHVYGGIQEIF